MAHNKNINAIVVLCDSKTIQRVAITCRCETRWIELVPKELHDSDMIAQFECPKCGTLYRLHHKQLKRVQEDAHDRQQKPFAAIKPDISKYDS
jgi:uncharacterized C2H2 Zn-finger protein